MTKYIICLGDGMADEPLASLNNKTPLEAAHIPHIDFLAKKGVCGQVHTVPDGLHPGSDIANMGLLGYDPRQYHTGRGPIEAASMDIQVASNQVVFRCNLVHINQGIMTDFTAGHISTEEAETLIMALNDELQDEFSQFFPGVSYRHILLLPDQFTDLVTCAPHDIIDQTIEAHLPHGTHADILTQFITRANRILSAHPINQQRIQNGLSPANAIWPWSQGKMPQLPPFKEKYQLSGGIITAVDLLKGLGQLCGLETPHIQGATGFIDTNYQAKVNAALKILDTHDFVYIHIEAPDECGHMGDEALKTKAIEDFDQQIINPICEYIKTQPDTVVMVLPDHPTPCHLKTHTNHPVPFLIYHPTITADPIQHYTEKDTQNSPLKFKSPWELLAHFLNQSPQQGQ